MTDLLLDTDVLIDHLRGATRLEIPPDVRPYVSVITRAELMAGPAEQVDAVAGLLASIEEIDVTPAIADGAGVIRRERELAMPDALIAATAMSHALSLRTRNRRHFERVEGLRLDPPS